MEDDKSSLEEYVDWRNSTTFLPLSKLQEVANDPRVVLPKCGGYHAICNDFEEMKQFFSRLENIAPLIDMGLLEHSEDTDWEDILGETDSLETSVRVGFSLYYNPFFDEEQAIQLHEGPFACLPDITFSEYTLEYVKFPCLVTYSYDADFDRVGDFSMNCCSIVNLEGVSSRSGDMKIVIDNVY